MLLREITKNPAVLYNQKKNCYSVPAQIALLPGAGTKYPTALCKHIKPCCSVPAQKTLLLYANSKTLLLCANTKNHASTKNPSCSV